MESREFPVWRRRSRGSSMVTVSQTAGSCQGAPALRETSGGHCENLAPSFLLLPESAYANIRRTSIERCRNLSIRERFRWRDRMARTPAVHERVSALDRKRIHWPFSRLECEGRSAAPSAVPGGIPLPRMAAYCLVMYLAEPTCLTVRLRCYHHGCEETTCRVQKT